MQTLTRISLLSDLVSQGLEAFYVEQQLNPFASVEELCQLAACEVVTKGSTDWLDDEAVREIALMERPHDPLYDDHPHAVMFENLTDYLEMEIEVRVENYS